MYFEWWPNLAIVFTTLPRIAWMGRSTVSDLPYANLGLTVGIEYYTTSQSNFYSMIEVIDLKYLNRKTASLVIVEIYPCRRLPLLLYFFASSFNTT